MKKSKPERRTTMMVCTLIAAAILGAAVTAQHGQQQPMSALAELESDLRMQLQMAFRHNTAQLESRKEHLDEVLNAWLQSPRTQADRQLLTHWLRLSIRNSMPGSTLQLPSLPPFSSPVPRKSPTAATIPDSPSANSVNLNSTNPVITDHRPVVIPVAPKIEQTDSALRTPPQDSSTTTDPKQPDRLPQVTEPPIVAKTSTVSKTPVATVPPNSEQTETTLPATLAVSADQATRIESPFRPRHRPPVAATRKNNPHGQTALFTGHTTKNSQIPAQPTNLRRTLSAADVAVNLAELAARTAGYHDGLNEIEADLFQMSEPGDSLHRLTSAQWTLGKLQQLVDDYQFIQLYNNLLTKKQHQMILKPRSPITLCERFSNSLSQWALPREDDFLNSFDQELPASQQAMLQSLRADLADLSARLRN